MYVYLWARVTSYAALPTPLWGDGGRGAARGEGGGVMARLLDGARRTRGCFVSVLFAPSHETTVFCLRARKEAAKIGGDGEGGRQGAREE